MSNQIKTAIRWQYWRDNVMVRSTPQTEITVETTSELFSDNTQVVGTTHELLAAGDVTDNAFAVIENLHATATVEIGGDDTSVFVPWLTIPAGGPPLVIPRITALADTYIKSSVASTPVRVTLIKVEAS
jgi:hypothetical protein